MRCPRCGHLEDKVLDSRTSRSGDLIRRRRACLGCNHRFTTREEVVRARLNVIKRDGRRETFERDKLVNGVQRACLALYAVNQQRLVIAVTLSAQMLDHKLDGILEVRKILTPEQFRKFMAKMDERQGQRFKEKRD